MQRTRSDSKVSNLKHITNLRLLYYFTAKILCLPGSLYAMYIIGREANLGVNSLTYSFSLPIIVKIEIHFSELLTAVIAVFVYIPKD